MIVEFFFRAYVFPFDGDPPEYQVWYPGLETIKEEGRLTITEWVRYLFDNEDLRERFSLDPDKGWQVFGKGRLEGRYDYYGEYDEEMDILEYQIAELPSWYYAPDENSLPSPKELTFDEFSVINLRRCESPKGFNHELHSWTLADWFTAALGELGEAANVAKKLKRIQDGIQGNKETETERALLEKLRQELADTFSYLDLLVQSTGFCLGDFLMDVFDAKSKEIGYKRD